MGTVTKIHKNVKCNNCGKIYNMEKYLYQVCPECHQPFWYVEDKEKVLREYKIARAYEMRQAPCFMDEEQFLREFPDHEELEKIYRENEYNEILKNHGKKQADEWLLFNQTFEPLEMDKS